MLVKKIHVQRTNNLNKAVYFVCGYYVSTEPCLISHSKRRSGICVCVCFALKDTKIQQENFSSTRDLLLYNIHITLSCKVSRMKQFVPVLRSWRDIPLKMCFLSWSHEKCTV
jgi:hypothetical protein